MRRPNLTPDEIHRNPALRWEPSDDPAVLCENVRALATHAYDTLHWASDGLPDSQSHEIGKLQDRLDQVQQQIDRFCPLHGLRLEDLQRWLDSLRRHIKDLERKW